MKTAEERISKLEREIADNQRVFHLMVGYGSASVFKDLNKRYFSAVREYRMMKKGELVMK